MLVEKELVQTGTAEKKTLGKAFYKFATSDME